MNEPRPVERPLRSPPVGAVLLALLAGLFYALELAVLRDASSGTGAGIHWTPPLSRSLPSRCGSYSQA